MATYHNPSSDLRKKVAKKTMKPCSTLLRGFYYAKGWLKDLTCPVISIDGTAEIATNVENLLNVFS